MEVMRIEDDIEQVALHAMGSAVAMFASLNQLALLFMKYFEHTEQGGWEQVMLLDAREKTYGNLPNGAMAAA